MAIANFPKPVIETTEMTLSRVEKVELHTGLKQNQLMGLSLESRVT